MLSEFTKAIKPPLLSNQLTMTHKRQPPLRSLRPLRFIQTNSRPRHRFLRKESGFQLPCELALVTI